MKKLMAIIVIAAALITVSCKKETVKLAGTKWKSSVSIVDGFHGEYLMTFVSDSTGMMDESVMEGDEVDVEKKALDAYLRLKDDLELFSAKYMSVSSLSDIDFSALLGEVVDLADKHHITMPGRFTMLVRSFLTIEGVMEQLCPELDLFDIISNKLMDRMKKSFSLEKEILNLGEGVLDVGKKVTRIPQLVAEFCPMACL